MRGLPQSPVLQTEARLSRCREGLNTVSRRLRAHRVKGDTAFD